MPVAVSRRTAALALALALAGCSRRAAPPARVLPPQLRALATAPRSSGAARVADHVHLMRLALPRAVPVGTVAAACGPGLIAIPLAGGVLAAGWNGWILEPEPGAPPITALTCDAQSRVIFARGTKLVRRGLDQTLETLGELPAGALGLVAADDAIWAYGATPAGTGALYRWDPASGVRAIWQGTRPVTAAAAAGAALVTCIDRTVLLWQPGVAPRRLARLDAACDGVAIDGGGRVYVSTRQGIVRLRGGAPPEVLAIGMHGALTAQGPRVYVVSAAGQAVFALAPAAYR